MLDDIRMQRFAKHTPAGYTRAIRNLALDRVRLQASGGEHRRHAGAAPARRQLRWMYRVVRCTNDVPGGCVTREGHHRTLDGYDTRFQRSAFRMNTR